MNIALWVVQVILSIKCLSIAYTHGLRQDKTTMQQGIQKMGAFARPLLAVISTCLFLSGIGLILPAAWGSLAWLAPWSAAIQALLMLLSILFHLRCQEKPKIYASIILFALAGFVAYGRWVLAPF